MPCASRLAERRRSSASWTSSTAMLPVYNLLLSLVLFSSKHGRSEEQRSRRLTDATSATVHASVTTQSLFKQTERTATRPTSAAWTTVWRLFAKSKSRTGRSGRGEPSLRVGTTSRRSPCDPPPTKQHRLLSFYPLFLCLSFHLSERGRSIGGQQLCTRGQVHHRSQSRLLLLLVGKLWETCSLAKSMLRLGLQQQQKRKTGQGRKIGAQDALVCCLNHLYRATNPETFLWKFPSVGIKAIRRSILTMLVILHGIVKMPPPTREEIERGTVDFLDRQCHRWSLVSSNSSSVSSSPSSESVANGHRLLVLDESSLAPTR